MTFHFSVEWSEEDGVYIARVEEFPFVATRGDSWFMATQEMLMVIACLWGW